MTEHLEKEELRLKEAEGEDAKSPEADPFVGTVFAEKYLILKSLGSGGFSKVYQALHIHLKKNVAIKVLHTYHASDEDKRQRFMIEARTTSALAHPNIVGLQDFGYWQDTPYLVMDYLEGRSLAELLKSGRQFSVQDVLEINAQVCQALSAAHTQGIIHRDLKPENIMMLAEQGAGPLLKVLDFGLAKVLQQEGESLLAETKTGQILGTPFYMSPEQCQGQQLDLRSDIYSLGCVTYELLTGAKPFSADSALALLLLHLNEKPQDFAGASGGKKISPAIEAAVLKAMAKQREERYGSCQEFHEALLKAQSSKSNSFSSAFKLFAARSAAGARNPKQPLTLLAALFSLLALCGTAAFFYISSSSTKQNGTEVAANLDPLSVWERFDRSGQQAINAGDYAAAERNLELAINTASTFSNKEQLVSSLKRKIILCHILKKAEEEQLTKAKLQATHAGGKPAAKASEAEPILSSWDLLPEDPKQLKPDKFDRLARETVRLAAERSRNGDPQGAIAILTKTLPVMRKAFSSGSSTLLDALIELGTTYQITGNREAEKILNEAYAMVEKQLFDGNLSDLNSFIQVVTALHQFRNDNWSLAQIEKALEYLKRTKGAHESDEAFCRLHKGKLLHALSRNTEALKVLTEALAIYKRLEATDNSLSLSNGLRQCASEIAGTELDSGHRIQAEIAMKQALVLWQKAASANDASDLGYARSMVTFHLRSLGLLYMQSGRLPEAQKYLQEALEFSQRKDPSGTDAQDSLYALLEFYDRQKNYKYEDPLLLEQLAIDEMTRAPDYLTCVARIGYSYAQRNQRQEARSFLQKYITKLSSLSLDEEAIPNLSATFLFNLLQKAGETPDFDRLESLLKKSLEQARKALPTIKLVEAEQLDNLANLYFVENKASAAERYFKDACKTITSNKILAGQRSATIFSDYADFLRAQQRFDEAGKIYRLKEFYLLNTYNPGQANKDKQ